MPRYALAQLQGGPLDGQTVRAPLRDDGTDLPVRVIGVPVPVLDERTERFWWDTANYFHVSVGTVVGTEVGTQRRPLFAYARTLPGYPTFTQDTGTR